MSLPSYSRRVALSLLAIVLAAALLGSLVSWASAEATPPLLDLNGDGAGNDYSGATFTEDEGAESIVNATGLRIENGDDTLLTAARAVLTNRPDSAVESLAADALATGLVVKYTAASGELTIKGTATITDYQSVLRTLSYNNLSPSPNPADRIVQVTVSDGAQVSLPATSTLAINAVNDAPVLDSSGEMSLVSINEDDVTSNGNSVGRIIESAEMEGQDRITDVDAGAVEGFAVIEAASGNGEWQYSLNAGASWQPFGAVSNTSAVLLDEVARIRFVPLPGFHGPASFTFRAWDQTSGENGDSGMDVSLNGGTTAFSSDSEMATINVLAVNDLPLVDLNGPEAGADFAANYYEGGPPVALADADATIADADHTTLLNLSLTLTARPDGAAELLAATTAGTNITAAPYDPATGLLLLTGPDSVANFQQVLRSATYHNTAANPATAARPIQVVAHDGTNPGNVALSTIEIDPQNTAPVLNSAAPLSLGGVAEDTTQPAGRLIADVLAAAGDPISDADEGALEGVAVVAADGSHGSWQYSLANLPAGPADWQPVGLVSGTTALLLADTAWLRFVPAANYAGPSGGLTLRAWDQTSGGNGQRADASQTGGATAFSEVTGSLSATVTPVNDPPLLGGLPAGALLYQEDAAALPLLPGVTVSDGDSAALAWARVRLTNPPDGDAEQLMAVATETGIAVAYEDGVLQLTGLAAPAAYQQVLRSVTYWNASQDPTAGDRQIEVTVGDAQAAAAPQVITLEVLPVNDPPSLDLDGVGGGDDYETTFYINRGPVAIVAPSLTLSDIDNTTIKSATVRITNLLNKQAEVLAADVTGVANIKRSFDPATGVLQLTGVDSVANYQRVLRTLTYENILPQPNVQDRLVEFRVDDGLGQSESRQTVIHLQVAPTVYQYMPIVAWVFERAEEPNDSCAEALGVALSQDRTFLADDKEDWFFFDLASATPVTVELRDLVGQLVVYTGQSCGSLSFLGSNGAKDEPFKTVALGTRPPGRYYIRVINDEAGESPYRLFVRTTP